VVANGSTDPIGRGWSVGGTAKLVSDGSGGLLWVDGDGGVRDFEAGNGTTFVSPPDDFGTLVKNSGGSYTYANPSGVTWNFNSSGQLTGGTVLDSGGGLNFSAGTGLLDGVTYDGTLTLAAGNAVVMLEHAIYSVISPEGCTSILWRDGEHAREAAEALRLTAQDLLRLGVIDLIVPEPLGGAHRLPKEAIEQLGQAIDGALSPLLGLDGDKLRAMRREKFLAMGGHGL